MSERHARFARAVFAATLALASPALAADLALPDGRAAVSYDDAIWSGAIDADGDLYFSCRNDICHVDSGFCTLTVAPAPGLTPATFFTSDFVTRTVAKLSNAGGEVLSPLAKATKGANTGMTTTLKLTYEQTPMRVQYFLIGMNEAAVIAFCAVADTRYAAASAAVEAVFFGIRVKP